MPEPTAAVQAPPIERLVEDYLAARRAKGLSPKTVKMAYGYPLRGVFLPWCERQGIVEASELTTRILERFSSELLELGGKRGRLSKDTVWTYLKAVRAFLTWTKAEGEKVEAEARLPKLPQRVIEVLSRQEVRRIEDAADSERDKLIVRILADTGLRVGELVKLRQRDLLDRDRSWYFRVQCKGERERLVPMSPTLARRLRRYEERAHAEETNSNRLFISRRRMSGAEICGRAPAAAHKVKSSSAPPP